MNKKNVKNKRKLKVKNISKKKHENGKLIGVEWTFIEKQNFRVEDYKSKEYNSG